MDLWPSFRAQMLLSIKLKNKQVIQFPYEEIHALTVEQRTLFDNMHDYFE